MDKILAKYGPKTGTMLVGPAGETCRMAASVQFSDPEGRPSRAAGRGGLGAVMGSKKVKAIVLDDAGCGMLPAADPEKFKAAAKRWAQILLGHPVTGQGLPTYGTAILVNIINEAGALPTKNFREGRFEHAAAISGEAIAETITKRGGKVKHGCHTGCVIQCSQEYVDKAGKYLTSGFEYETVWAFGANTLIKDLDDIAALDRACDDMGLDTIDLGNTMAMAMEGGIIAWGDGKAAESSSAAWATRTTPWAASSATARASPPRLRRTACPWSRTRPCPPTTRAASRRGVTYAPPPRARTTPQATPCARTS
jgi:aldehyde:ferredoxin oxidoreductase